MTRYGKRSGLSLRGLAEAKYIDFVTSGASHVTGTVISLELSNIAEGGDRFQRNGRRVIITKIECRGSGGRPGGGGIDWHLWSPRATSNPVLADFTGIIIVSD